MHAKISKYDNNNKFRHIFIYLFIYLSYDKPSQSKDMLSTLKVKNMYEGKK